MEALLKILAERGVQLGCEEGRLMVKAPQGALTDELKEELSAHKEKLLALLGSARHGQDLPPFAVRPDLRLQPFGLTDVQHAYWMGRNDYVELGGVATHFYIELEREGLDIERLNASLRQVIARHDMLRAVISKDGSQRILDEVPEYRIALTDLGGQPAAVAAQTLDAIRAKMSHNMLPTEQWPLFEIQAARLEDGRLRLFISLDMLIVDASSIFLLFQDWQRFYERPDWAPAPFALSYRDYAEFEHKLQDAPGFRKAREYWQQRLDTLPPAPALPLAVQPGTLTRTEFKRRQATLAAEQWAGLKERARQHGVTVSVLLMTAFSEVLRAWSKEPDFTLNLTLFNRFPIHPQVNQLIGDFTTTNLLAVHAHAGESFLARVRRLQGQLAEDLEHRQYSGMRVLRDRARRMGNAPGAAMPIVFTSTLALDAQRDTAGGLSFFGDYVYGISQTPQVWLDHQMIEWKDELVLIWDAIEALFPERMLDDMFAAYGDLVARLACDDEAWLQTAPLLPLPAWQQQARLAANSTASAIEPVPLHQLVARHYVERADAPAVLSESGVLSYRELGEYAYRVARCLRQLGIGKGDLVAVAMQKGWEQVAAVLGVLHAGAAYLPIDPTLPQERRWNIAGLAGARVVLTQPALRTELDWPAAMQVLTLDDSAIAQCDGSPFDTAVSPGDLAYVLFTSGSTGTPKGVMIEHRNASNTVQAINERFRVVPEDRLLALSALHFDLSVYDLFGVLGAGAALVLPSPAAQTDPEHWTRLAREHGVTLWNSVPQLLQLWVEHLQAKGLEHAPLRWAILSGDWIPVALPDSARAVCRQLRILASGGPTETAIWCTGYEVGEVPPDWRSIPYGKPLANQTMHVLNNLLEDRPVWVPGEIHIGGMAPGRGYLNDASRSAEKFIIHPLSGERLYKSGDLGRYLPDGNIEFLGREDFQVKINGLRIELGEIEAVLRRQPGVHAAVVGVAAPGDTGPRQLVAYVVPEPAARWQPEALSAALAQKLPDYMVPRHYQQLASLPLSANGKVDYKALPPLSTSQPAAPKQAPRSEAERRLFAIWQGLLGEAEFGVEDNFFSLGADSINLVQMMGRVGSEFPLPDVSQQELFQRFFAAPTIAGFAALLERLCGSRLEQAGLAQDAAQARIEPDPAQWHEPFPLSDLQSAYLAGRMAEMEYHAEPNYYLEVDFAESFDPPRFERALNAMLERQRANLPVLDEDMQLRVPRELPQIVLIPRDLRALDPAAAEQALLAIRTELSHQTMPIDRWPWVQFGLTLHGGGSRLHINVSNFFVDAFGAMRFADAVHYYHHPDRPLPPLTISVRDGVLAYRQLESSPQGLASRQYWMERVPELPEPPAIPLVAQENPRSRSLLQRREMFLPAELWEGFKQKAARYGVTTGNAVYTAYAAVLSAWSGSRHFLLSHMLTQRLPLHPQMRDIIGNYAAVYPLEIDWRQDAPFFERVRAVQLQLLQDGQHIYWGSARIWQALNRQRKSPGRAVSPFVVVSGLDMPPRDAPNHGCLQTPQVLIDQQLWMLADGRFWATWDVNERFFPPGVIDAMWEAYRRLLTWLAEDEQAWQRQDFDLLPPEQRLRRAHINDTAQPLPPGLLHEPLAAAAARHPDKPAVIGDRRKLSYGELNGMANRLGHHLRAGGAEPGELVAIFLAKGWQQVVAAFGILAAGAAYVPIDPNLPEERIRYLLQNTGVRQAVTDPGGAARLKALADIQTVCVDTPALAGYPDTALPVRQQPGDLAYVIYTSGSTGQPKGVMIDHRGALNTIADINRRFGVSGDDVLFGISALNFDLSVYDLFGSVLAGATLVLPDASDTPDPLAWAELVRQHGVTVWNSVPALAQLLADAATAAGITLPSLRTVMMSGDWIPLPLPALLRRMAPAASLISLGGATEASIWSIYYPISEVEAGWASIPYGRPLANQAWHVLDEQGNNVPDGVAGQLYIGGAGLALGYWRDERKTAAAFVTHPRTGERLYRTGDLGRYLPDGNIEFLGRADFQVKIQGYRIELGEVESALLAHPGVQGATVIARGEKHGRQLVAYIIADAAATAADLQSFLRGKLPSYMVPAQFVLLERFPLTANGKVDRNALLALAPQGTVAAQAGQPPGSEQEAALVRIWEEVLGISPIGIHDDFFELGGQSLAAIQVMTRIAQRFGLRLPLAALFEGATVARLAARLAAAPSAAWSPLVPVKPDGAGTPYFFVHPAGGNVLCYRKLAERLDRPLYGLQAAGLTGEQTPIGEVERMAASYMQAMRERQPCGPYRLGGWSSGAVIAFEMARQLELAGETVEHLFILDAPAPRAIEVGEATLQAWFEEDLGAGAEAVDPAQRQAIYAVFASVVRACLGYRAEPIRADLSVLRASEGRVSEFAGHPDAALPDWGWRRLTSGTVHCTQVPGTHYTILDEPNVGALAQQVAALRQTCPP
jgi:yersiniabactin nonribosomal peptide synthetase